MVVNMPARTKKRKSRADSPKFHITRQPKISDAAVVRGVETEFDRTLPYWRCYTDLHLESGCKPQVLHRSATLLCRIPCTVFKKVDVVWARTQVQLQCMAKSARCWRRSPVDKTKNPLKQLLAASPAVLGAKEIKGDVVSYTIDTLHFVHASANKKGLGADHSFHVQSVVLRDAPEVLQCVAGAMVSFSFLIYTSLRLVRACQAKGCHVNQLSRELEPLIQTCQQAASAVPQERVGGEDSRDSLSSMHRPPLLGGRLGSAATSQEAASAATQLRRWCPPTTSRVLVLGMGGNSMALALRLVLGPDAVMEVVEVEPAVVKACLCAKTLREDDTNTKVHLQDVEACLRTLPDAAYDFIFMDIFEPMEATMKNLHPWVATAREKLTAGGLLVMNEHQLPSAEGLAPYGALFGESNVQAVNLRGWNESVVVCVAPGNAETDTCSAEITKGFSNVAFNIYEALLPGWLPHFSWLVSVKTHAHEKKRFRLWTS